MAEAGCPSHGDSLPLKRQGCSPHSGTGGDDVIDKPSLLTRPVDCLACVGGGVETKALLLVLQPLLSLEVVLSNDCSGSFQEGSTRSFECLREHQR